MEFAYVRHLHGKQLCEWYMLEGARLYNSAGYTFWELGDPNIELLAHETYENWLDLYQHTGYCDLEVDPFTCGIDIWISPKGLCCYGEPFWIYAPDILRYFYPDTIFLADEAVATLRSLGWINTQHELYQVIVEGKVFTCTTEQEHKIVAWAYVNQIKLDTVVFNPRKAIGDI